MNGKKVRVRNARGLCNGIIVGQTRNDIVVFSLNTTMGSSTSDIMACQGAKLDLSFLSREERKFRGYMLVRKEELTAQGFLSKKKGWISCSCGAGFFEDHKESCTAYKPRKVKTTRKEEVVVGLTTKRAYEKSFVSDLESSRSEEIKRKAKEEKERKQNRLDGRDIWEDEEDPMEEFVRSFQK